MEYRLLNNIVEFSIAVFVAWSILLYSKTEVATLGELAVLPSAGKNAYCM
jgi:hypothetical protein